MTKRLLVATVGGVTAPLCASILHWKPMRVFFIPSAETREKIEIIVAGVQAGGYEDFDAGRYDIYQVPDHQDYTGICTSLLELDQKIQTLQRDHRDLEIIADLTGGTKPMSAALALSAGHWKPCTISYVGGEARTKDGVGIVVDGKENIVYSQHPWDALGILAVDQAHLLLEAHAFASAEALLELTLVSVNDTNRKQQINAIKMVAKAYAAWDRFDYQMAVQTINDLSKQENHLKVLLGPEKCTRVFNNLKQLQDHCSLIWAVGADGKNMHSRALILDLIANAERRLDEHRWDDATSRLYRCIEAIAQWKLQEKHSIRTSAVPLDRLTPSLHHAIVRAKQGKVQLGLWDAWLLLSDLGDESAEVFKNEYPESQQSPLAVRNNSLLAHGFEPVPRSAATSLFQGALKLMGVDETALPRYRWI